MNKNYTVSRERLLNNVWGDKSDLKVNTVDCYISNIRRKLGLKKKSEFIKTSHGYGYTLVV
jgi:DNA-binding response OmpR family regulator